ncbi:glutamate receptor 1-like [Leptidea sinapis]|uniref:glutamate receptor 1-like n=1 Tax=Leptidea sinapis TaxID=189913 RepID=UPI0021C412EA|nr:glutamate receptor 1-like [Leptidea sinapis]
MRVFRGLLRFSVVSSFFFILIAKNTKEFDISVQKSYFTLGIIFDKDSDEEQEIFKTAMAALSRLNNSHIEFRIFIDVINTADVFKLSRLICKHYTRGAVAILGSVPSDSFSTLHSYSNTFRMPFITPWFPEKLHISSPGVEDFALSLRPDYHKAIMDIIIYYQWANVLYIYDSHDGLMRLQSIFHELEPGNKSFHVSMVKHITRAQDAVDFLAALEIVDRWSNKYIVLDSSSDMAKEIIVKHAQDLRLGRRTYHYFLCGFVLDEIWDKSVNEYGTINITGFRLIQYTNTPVQALLDIWKKRKISARSALVYDSVHLLTESISRIIVSTPQFLRASTKRVPPDANNKSYDCNLEQEGISPFEYGELLSDTIRKTEIDGLTGYIRFDANGRRLNFTIQVMTMDTKGNMRLLGTWHDDKGFITDSKPQDIFEINRNKTYIVMSILEDPYVIPVVDYKSAKRRYEGFCVDLTKLLMDKLDLKYEFRIAKDGKHGKVNPEVIGGWDGLIGILVRKEADMAISPLTVTVEREAIVDFSKTFLSFDTVTKSYQTSLSNIFAFLQPLSNELWYAILGSLGAVSVCLYIVSKYSPDEWQFRNTPNAGVQSNDQRGSNYRQTFSFWSAIWFTLGSFVQQSSGVTPRSLSGRIISAAWWFTTLLIITIYTANLASNLTVMQMTPQSNLHRVSKCPEEKNKPCDMVISVMESGLQDFAVAFPKGSPLREGVNMALLMLRNDGELYRLIQKWFIPHTCNNQADGKEMTLTQFAGIFYILTGVLGVAMIIALIEYIVHRRCGSTDSEAGSPPGSPVHTPQSPVIRLNQPTPPRRSRREADSIDWDTVTYTAYGSPSNTQMQDEAAALPPSSFRQV